MVHYDVHTTHNFECIFSFKVKIRESFIFCPFEDYEEILVSLALLNMLNIINYTKYYKW